MSVLVQATKFVQTVPKSVLVILVTISVVGFFVVEDKAALVAIEAGKVAAVVHAAVVIRVGVSVVWR